MCTIHSSDISPDVAMFREMVRKYLMRGVIQILARIIDCPPSVTFPVSNDVCIRFIT